MSLISWKLAPVAFEIFNVPVHWYGILFASALIISIQILEKILRVESVTKVDLDAIFVKSVLGIIIGARLVHCFIYSPSYYLMNPLQIFAVWEGGLASHGGAIGLFSVVYLHARKLNINILWLLDRIAIPAALFAVLIRLGNFANSEIIGLPSQLPWAIVFERIDNIPRHPVQLYEALAYFVVFVALVVLYSKTRIGERSGMLLGVFLSSVFTARLFLETFKTQQGIQVYSGSLSTGQILSFPFLLSGIFLLVRSPTRFPVNRENVFSE